MYFDIPQFYVFDKKQKIWIKRKKYTKPVISRMYLVNPRQREKFYLRLLLLHVKGATCFADLRTVNDIILPTFCEAAEERK